MQQTGFISRILRGFADITFPPHCTICDTYLIPPERFLCSGCLEDLTRTHFHRRAHNPMEQRLVEVPFVRATAWLYYKRDMDAAKLIARMKYNHSPDLAQTLGKAMGDELFPTAFFSDIDLILPIPIHLIKRLRRGYNQSREISLGVTEATGVPTGKQLYARRHHPTQTARTAEQRRRNVENVFGIRDPESLHGLHVLILDDVCTTGATLLQAAQTILAAQPDCRISFLTLACTL